MSEEETMERQNDLENDLNDSDLTAYINIPYFILDNDEHNFGKYDFSSEFNKINSLYIAYQRGSKFITEGHNGQYIPSQLRYKKAATIINKEARFMFSNPPTFNVNIDDVDDKFKNENTLLQNLLDKVLKKNNFSSKISKAIKDCLIGKRIAIVLNFNEKGITITFLNPLEFIYDFSEEEEGKLKYFSCFYNSNIVEDRTEQRWFKKTYELEDDKVYLTEQMYDGFGEIVEEITPKTQIEFNYIPAVIVLNDGLTGDVKGESELRKLLDYEEYYSKLANADMDSERKSMNPVRYAIDASENSTSNLSSSPGSFWDIQSDDSKSEMQQASVGMLEANMNYSTALKTTLDRIEDTMHSEVDVPNITSEQLKGVITSGKTLKALYWGLVIRCNEKMLTWGPALEFMARTIIDGSKLYPESAKVYMQEKTPDIEYDILVENNYALPEDEESEKQIDIAEVDAKLMSKKAYLKKWRRLTDKEAEEELMQIKEEMDLFENSASLNTYPIGDSLGYIQESPGSSQKDKKGNDDINNEQI